MKKIIVGLVLIFSECFASIDNKVDELIVRAKIEQVEDLKDSYLLKLPEIKKEYVYKNVLYGTSFRAYFLSPIGSVTALEPYCVVFKNSTGICKSNFSLIATVGEVYYLDDLFNEKYIELMYEYRF